MKKLELSVKSSDVDQFLELTIPAYFLMMQIIATSHAEELGIGKAETLDKGMAWVITRIEVDVVKTPVYTQKVFLETYPGDDLKVLFPRYFRLTDERGNVLIKSSSIWAVIDMNKRTPVAKPFKSIPEPEHYEDELSLPNRVNIPEDLQLVEERKVRYSDIDLNGHLNNTKYMDYILDVHDSSFYKKKRIKHVTINYLHEVKDGTIVKMYSSNSEPEVIVGKVDDKVVFVCEFKYENRK